MTEALPRSFYRALNTIMPINPVSKTRRLDPLPMAYQKRVAEKKYNQEAPVWSLVKENDYYFGNDCKIVQQVFKKLIAHCEQENLEYEVRVIDSYYRFDAFNLPNGKIGIASGDLVALRKITGSDDNKFKDAVAFLMGHELTHANASAYSELWPLGRLISLALVASLLVAVYNAYHVLLHRTNKLSTLALACNYLPLASLLVFQRYRRGTEHEADLHGLSYMKKAEYSLEGAQTVMGLFHRMDGIKEGEKPSRLAKFRTWFKEHPRPDQRLERINQEIQRLESQG